VSQEKQWPVNRLVEVEWHDSSSRGRWDTPAEYVKTAHVGPCRSVGYLIQANSKLIQLVQSQSSRTGDVSDGVTIPRKAVVRIRRLRGGLR